MSKMIMLIGGPKHGKTITLPDEINFRRVDMQDSLEDDGSSIYTICRTGDGHFYGVFDPVDDPSFMRVQALREALKGI